MGYSNHNLQMCFLHSQLHLHVYVTPDSFLCNYGSVPFSSTFCTVVCLQGGITCVITLAKQCAKRACFCNMFFFVELLTTLRSLCPFLCVV